MSNSFKTILKIVGETGEVEKCFNDIIIDEEFDFNFIQQKPKELDGTGYPSKPMEDSKYDKLSDLLQKLNVSETKSKELISKFGSDNWHDWSIDKWGTSRSPYYIDCYDFVDKVSFKTDDSFPEEALNKLSLIYPNLTFECEYSSEVIGEYCGEISFKNGEVIHFKNQEENYLFSCMTYYEEEGEDIYKEMVLDGDFD